MIFILLLSSICLCVKAENGYGYEVEVVPLKDTSEVDKPFNAAPTGGYTFLGFGAKDANAPNNQAAIGDGPHKIPPEMHLGLNTVPSESQGNRHVMDLVLVMDSSYSITSKGWIKAKNAAKKLIDGLDISPEGTHVSIMKFSTDVEAYYMFDPNATKEKLKQLLDDLQFDGEWSRMDLAMQQIVHHAFAPISGARLGDVPKVVVIFSDGKSDGPTPPEEEIDWDARVAEQVKLLRKKNVGIFSVAVGVPDKRALGAIAGSPARVFDRNSLDNLATAIKGESKEIPPPEPPAMPMPTSLPPPFPPISPWPPQPQSVAPQSQSVAPQSAVVITSLAIPTTSTSLGTCTAFQTVTLTTGVATTPVTIVIATETQTSLLTAIETASTLVVTATETDTVTETVTATATQSLTSTAVNTATSTVIATEIATEVLTLTTTVGVTSTTYAKASATPVPITIMGSAQGKKRNKIPRVKRWYEDYVPNAIQQWMAIKD